MSPSRIPVMTHERDVRSGFTLLEVLLTSLLASIVLVSLWSLSDIYLKMFAAGQRKIEETQLIRGLTAQIAKDVSQVIQLAEDSSDTGIGFTRADRDSTQPLPLPPPGGRSPGQNPASRRPTFRDAPPPANVPPQANPNSPFPPPPQLNIAGAPGQLAAAGTASGPMPSPMGSVAQKQNQLVPRFGLFGTRQALRLIVLQADPRIARGPSDLDDVLPEPGKQRTPLAMELRTIQYTFAPPHELNTSDQQHPGGLVRRDWAWEIWASRMMATMPSTSSRSSLSLLPVSESEWTSEDALALQEDRDLFHVSQVVGLEFRYYDGEKWEVQWDSWERKSLPRLVEVFIKIRLTKEKPGPTNPEEFVEEDSVTSLSEESVVSSPTSVGHGRVYRKLISLPFAEPSSGTREHGPSSSPTEMAGSLMPANPVGRRQP